MSGSENNTSLPSESDKIIAEGETWEMQYDMIMDAADNHAAKITVVDAVKVAEEKVAKIIADAVKVAEEIAAKIIADAEEMAAKIIADAEEMVAGVQQEVSTDPVPPYLVSPSRLVVGGFRSL